MSIFGTDGVRGRAGEGLLAADSVAKYSLPAFVRFVSRISPCEPEMTNLDQMDRATFLRDGLLGELFNLGQDTAGSRRILCREISKIAPVSASMTF